MFGCTVQVPYGLNIFKQAKLLAEWKHSLNCLTAVAGGDFVSYMRSLQECTHKLCGAHECLLVL